MKTKFMLIAVILGCALSGYCEENLINVLNKSHREIMTVVQTDAEIKQQWLNRAIAIAVSLAEDEVNFREGLLIMRGIKVPRENWYEEYKKALQAPTGYEGGSAAPYVAGLRAYDMLTKRIEELKKAQKSKR